MALIYCKECGKQVSDQAPTCPHCGCVLSTSGNQVASYDPDRSKYDWLTTLLLCFFLGGLGIHSFYVKKTGIGIVQLFTAGGCGVWALIDFIMIIVGSYRDGEGKIIKNDR